MSTIHHNDRNVQALIHPIDATNNSVSENEKTKKSRHRKVSNLKPQKIIETDHLQNLKPLKGRVSIIQSLMDKITAFFYKIFCYSKWKKTQPIDVTVEHVVDKTQPVGATVEHVVDKTQPVGATVEHVVDKTQPIDATFECVINDATTATFSKNILLNKNVKGEDCEKSESANKLTPLSNGSAVQMPRKFVLDLHRIDGVIINGESYDNRKSDEERETIVGRMKSVLGDAGAIAAGRLLNQSGIADAYARFYKKRVELNELQGANICISQVGTLYYEIETVDQEVIITLSIVFQGRDLDTLEYDGKFIGLASTYKISLEALNRIGAVGSQSVDANSFNIELSHVFTKTYLSADAARAALK